MAGADFQQDGMMGMQSRTREHSAMRLDEVMTTVYETLEFRGQVGEVKDSMTIREHHDPRFALATTIATHHENAQIIH